MLDIEIFSATFIMNSNVIANSDNGKNDNVCTNARHDMSKTDAFDIYNAIFQCGQKCLFYN